MLPSGSCLPGHNTVKIRDSQTGQSQQMHTMSLGDNEHGTAAPPGTRESLAGSMHMCLSNAQPPSKSPLCTLYHDGEYVQAPPDERSHDTNTLSKIHSSIRCSSSCRSCPSACCRCSCPLTPCCCFRALGGTSSSSTPSTPACSSPRCVGLLI